MALVSDNQIRLTNRFEAVDDGLNAGDLREMMQFGAAPRCDDAVWHGEFIESVTDLPDEFLAVGKNYDSISFCRCATA